MIRVPAKLGVACQALHHVCMQAVLASHFVCKKNLSDNLMSVLTSWSQSTYMIGIPLAGIQQAACLLGCKLTGLKAQAAAYMQYILVSVSALLLYALQLPAQWASTHVG